jgi:hypothetical protein
MINLGSFLGHGLFLFAAIDLFDAFIPANNIGSELLQLSMCLMDILDVVILVLKSNELTYSISASAS